MEKIHSKNRPVIRKSARSEPLEEIHQEKLNLTNEEETIEGTNKFIHAVKIESNEETKPIQIKG